MSRYYKFLTRDHRGPYSGFDYTPYLPTGDEPGPWLPTIPGGKRALRTCERGYHYCNQPYLFAWIDDGVSDELYEVEPGRTGIGEPEKLLSTRLRLIHHVGTLTPPLLRRIAADCAERVLPIFERAYPNDDRPRRAIAVARAVADGAASSDDLHDAWAAALVPVELTQRAAVRIGTRAADSVHEAAKAASDSADASLMNAVHWAAAHATFAAAGAAWGAAKDGTRHLARDAAEAAEPLWQTEHLLASLRDEVSR